jgi:hypothetical protein
MAVNAIADLRHSKDGLSVQIRAEAVFLAIRRFKTGHCKTEFNGVGGLKAHN